MFIPSFSRVRKVFIALSIVLLLVTTTACGTVSTSDNFSNKSLNPRQESSYQQLERGNTSAGQDFGAWVVQTAKGLVRDAYVRDDNKLGVLISQQVKPDEVKSLAKSLVQGFHKNFPNRDLSVFMFAPDKSIILTARYNDQSHDIQYQ
jgi:outer membrane PBP1 activator LpoA protein